MAGSGDATWIEAPAPADEPARLDALRRYQILDTGAEQAYEDMVLLASQICGTPVALVSLVDSDRQWFKAKLGIDAPQTPRSMAFCTHAILEPEQVLVVPDAARDERFAGNPLVTADPHIRFYAGAPLVTPEGHALGTLCVIDRQPRRLSESQLDSLRALSRQVVHQLELRRVARELSEHGQMLEEKQHELERSNRDLDDFAYIASHDLREPLRGIHTYSRFLIEDHADELGEDARQRVDRIGQLTLRLEDLIATLLEFSRVGREALQPEETDVGLLVEELIERLDPAGSEDVEILVPEPLPTLCCDRQRLAQVLQNLISNGLKYNESPVRRVEIRCDASDPERPAFSVRDNGIGIDEKHRERVFGLFRRLHARDRYGGGTGAGLCIVKKLVTRQGGEIDFESAPGEGSCFRFSLATPRSAGEAKPEAPEATPPRVS